MEQELGISRAGPSSSETRQPSAQPTALQQSHVHSTQPPGLDCILKSYRFYRSVKHSLDRLWWYLPQPPLISSQLPSPSKYFAWPLLLWMPIKLWHVILFCPHPGCYKKELTSAGLYPHICQVLILMATTIWQPSTWSAGTVSKR